MIYPDEIETSENAHTIAQNCIRAEGGDLMRALYRCAEFAEYCWQTKGSGIDREGGPRHAWKPEKPPAPIVTSLEK